MSKFIVRIELHEKTPSHQPNYEILHACMRGAKFQRTAIFENKEYFLPTAEYFIDSNLGIDQIGKMAKDAANKSGYKNSVLITLVASLREIDLPLAAPKIKIS